MNTNETKPWQLTHNGKSWRDMPGETHDIKKLNFFLFRRGLFDPEGWRERLFPDLRGGMNKKVIEGRRAARVNEMAMEIESSQQLGA